MRGVVWHVRISSLINLPYNCVFGFAHYSMWLRLQKPNSISYTYFQFRGNVDFQQIDRFIEVKNVCLTTFASAHPPQNPKLANGAKHNLKQTTPYSNTGILDQLHFDITIVEIHCNFYFSVTVFKVNLETKAALDYYCQWTWVYKLI